MLTVQRLDVSYGRTRVLFGVSLEVPDSGMVCLMGRNGVGKTTLLSAVMGLLRPTAGTVAFDGKDITSLRPYERVRLGMGYVPQGHETFPHLTVKENLGVVLDSMGGRTGPRGRNAAASSYDDALDLFPRLRPLLGRRAGFLSGGQQQQLAIARALITKPRLLLLDEPTEGIQPSIVLEIEDAITELHKTGSMAILLVEQYVEFALGLADHYVVLDAGEVIESGETKTLEEATVRRLLAV